MVTRLMRGGGGIPSEIPFSDAKELEWWRGNIVGPGGTPFVVERCSVGWGVGPPSVDHVR